MPRVWISGPLAPSATNPMHLDYQPGQDPISMFCQANGISVNGSQLTIKRLEEGETLNNDGTPTVESITEVVTKG